MDIASLLSMILWGIIAVIDGCIASKRDFPLLWVLTILEGGVCLLFAYKLFS